MNVAWKILAGAVALVVVVLIGAAITIATVDVNTLIGPVKARVLALTGRDLTVNGEANLTFSLEPKLVLRDVTLANAPWGTAPSLLSAKRLELQIALMPLLSRKFEVIELALIDPVIALETDSAGHGNWDLSVASAATNTAAGAGMATPTPAIGNFSITGGTLTFRDARSGHQTLIAIDTLALRSRDAQAPIAAQFRGKVDDVTVALEGTLGPLESLIQQRWPYPVTLKGKIEGRQVDVATKVTKNNTTYVLDDLDLHFGANTVAGKFSVITGGVRPKLVFELATAALAMADLPLGTAATPAASAVVADRRGRTFADTPVDFSLLRAVDMDGRISIGKLTLLNGGVLGDVKMQLALAAGRL
ncbi:MAG: AsmA family protein, partial [Betaproteobacteria bacterium]